MGKESLLSESDFIPADAGGFVSKHMGRRNNFAWFPKNNTPFLFYFS